MVMALYLRPPRSFSAWTKVAFTGDQVAGFPAHTVGRWQPSTFSCGARDRRRRAGGQFYRALFGREPRPVGGGRSTLSAARRNARAVSTGDSPHDAPQDLYFEVDDLETYHGEPTSWVA